MKLETPNSKLETVAIVGGGPAGSTLAWALRDTGLTITIIDKRSFPRDKVCAGWVTPPVVEMLKLDLADYRKARTLQPITGFRVGAIGRQPVVLNYDKPVSFGIRRCEFDDYLLQRCGATLRLNEPVRSLDRTPAGWRINDEIDADLLVGAAGHACPVARKLAGEGIKTECVVTAQELEVQLTAEQWSRCPVLADQPELYFCNDLAGYGWCFRKGDYLNVGIGRENDQQLAQHADDFLSWLKRMGRLPADLPGKMRGHAYLLYGRSHRPAARDHALLVGDAVGLAYPQSGEGIRTAVESSLLAAAAIRKALADPAHADQYLASYESALQARFGNPAPAAESASSRLIPGWARQALANQLLRSRWFTRNVLIDRWFLHRQTPALQPVTSSG